MNIKILMFLISLFLTGCQIIESDAPPTLASLSMKAIVMLELEDEELQAQQFSQRFGDKKIKPAPTLK